MTFKPAGKYYILINGTEMETQFITDAEGRRIAVILPIQAYEKLLEYLEELHDVQLYDEAKSRKQEFVPAEYVFKAIEHKRKEV
jgi:hypothetical protein